MNAGRTIHVQGLGKRFKLYPSPWARLSEWATAGRLRRYEEFWALKDVSFELRPGECLGVIGANGAGKSTLLKILTGALHPTEGSFSVHGRVLSLLELGTGFNQELTGRQNVVLSGQLLGWPSKSVTDAMARIEEFAELGDFFDRPLRTYSSGMRVRIAFSMFACMQPEVFIVDEALSVGDIFFQQKCFARMREMVSSNATCLFASHDMNAVLNLCTQAILLEHGRIVCHGKPEEVVSRYYGTLGTRPPKGTEGAASQSAGAKTGAAPCPVNPEAIVQHSILTGRGMRHGARGMEVRAARVTDKSGQDTLTVEMLGTLVFDVLIRALEDVEDPSSGIHIYDRLGNLVFAAGTRQLGQRLPDLKAGDEMVVRLEIGFSVQPGEYSFSLGCAELSADKNPNVGYIHDRHEMLGPIVVTYDQTRVFPFYGIARLPAVAGCWKVQRNLQHDTVMPIDQGQGRP